MSIPILEVCRKRKRRPKLFNFQSFGEEGVPIAPKGPFRDNIRLFLEECGEREDYKVEGMSIWCTLLQLPNSSVVVPLYTIQEDVKHALRPFCDQCRCSGWSNNFVSQRKYHMIIPADGDWNKPLEDDVFYLQTHLLHGLIHSNGYGHLICINGIEGGSKHLRGRDIMDLWDRICTNLHARVITVEDVSKKRSMDLRLLYGIAYGHPWFGRWGYMFLRGNFGVTELNYMRAIDILSSMQLDEIVQDFSNTEQCSDVKRIVSFYRYSSETNLITLRDLLRFMLTINSCRITQKKQGLSAVHASPPPDNVIISPPRKKLVVKNGAKHKTFNTLVKSLDSRWPARRLEFAADVIVEALKTKKADKYSKGGMSRQDVRDAARMHIGDTGLLDYVLKSMNNVSVGSHVVYRAMNPKTKILEYFLDEVGDGSRRDEVVEAEGEGEMAPAVPIVPGADLYTDVAFLYSNVLLSYPGSELIELATQAVLDSKHFVKKWPFKDEKDQVLRFICQVVPDFHELEIKSYGESPPGEIVVLPLYATLVELKEEAERALRNTYCVMENFVVTDIEYMDELEDGDLLFGAVESGAQIIVRGTGIDQNTELRYEGGPDHWKVRCECGAQDDDGERMFECDVCGVWQHTRCNGIEDSENVPQMFVCAGCCDSLVPSRTDHLPDSGTSDDVLVMHSTEFPQEFLLQKMMLQSH